MDIAYLNAVLRSPYMPPIDPYYAHGYLNYYYYGQFLVAIVTRVTGIRPTVAFNLAVPLFFALTVSTAFSIGYSLAGRVRLGRRTNLRAEKEARAGYGVAHGLWSVLCVTVLGNLASATQIVERLGRLSKTDFTSRIPGVQALVRAASGAWQVALAGARFPGFNYWDPSRVVGCTINEFPYWSFLFADMHPHMMNIPFTLLAIAFALNWLLREPHVPPPCAAARAVPEGEWGLVWSSARTAWQRMDWGAVLNWVLWPVALGALAAINTWDWPAYAGLSGLALLFVAGERRGRQGLIPALLVAIALAGISLVLYAPFFKYYTALFVGLGWSLGRGHTELGEFLTVWGFFLFLAVSVLVAALVAQRARWRALRVLRLGLRHLTRLPRLEELYAAVAGDGGGYRRWTWIALLGVAILAWWAWRSYWVLTIMVPLLLLAGALVVQGGVPRGQRFVLGLVFAAFLLLVGVELFYLKDHLDGDQAGWWRMNTLFKFYLQVWVMLGVALGASLPSLWQFSARWGRGTRRVWRSAFAVLLAAAALYPLLGTPARVMDRFPGERPTIGTLDGMAFMTVGTYTWPDEDNPIHLRGDYDAIRWLMENVRGTPVLAEAPIGYYREFGVRVSSYTGLPTLLGMHESEQRYADDVGRRSHRAGELFRSLDMESTLSLIRELRVEYVYIGPLERTLYPQAPAKFDRLAALGHLTVVYRNDQVTIYRVSE